VLVVYLPAQELSLCSTLSISGVEVRPDAYRIRLFLPDLLSLVIRVDGDKWSWTSVIPLAY
jgi:hypothetical protein